MRPEYWRRYFEIIVLQATDHFILLHEKEREMAGSRARQNWTVSSCRQKEKMDWGAGCTSESWKEEERGKRGFVGKMTEAGQGGESVENRKRTRRGMRKGIGGKDDRSKPKRCGQVTESK